METTREAIARLAGAGRKPAMIVNELGLARPTVDYHLGRLRDGSQAPERITDAGADTGPKASAGTKAVADSACSVRTREQVAEMLNSGITRAEAARRLGISKATVSYHARRVGAPIDASCARRGTYRGRYNLKSRLLRNGLKDGSCERCGVTEWRGQPITLALHHVNGVRNDNRLENLQLLCPNCHSQTDSYAGRNGGRRGVS